MLFLPLQISLQAGTAAPSLVQIPDRSVGMAGMLWGAGFLAGDPLLVHMQSTHGGTIPNKAEHLCKFTIIC